MAPPTRSDAESERLGDDDLAELSPIALRARAVTVLGIDRPPVTDLALVRELLRALEAEQCARLGVPWWVVEERSPDPRLLVPRGVTRLPD